MNHRLFSPAKINLMLRVVGQRQDGYHNLQTCFQLLDWGDEIVVSQTKQGDDLIEVHGFDGLPLEQNLMYRAAQMLHPHAQNAEGFRFDVNKKIPLGAGLGGGSSNAATVLMFLNQHWQCGLNQQQLIELGAQLGADVPIFVLGQSALATGIGDQLEPMSFVTPHVLLMFPKVSIPTAALFAAPELQRRQQLLAMHSIKEAAFWINDFMPVVLQQYPELNALYQKLKAHMMVRLSGTGSTLFALFDDADQAQQAALKAAAWCDVQLTTAWQQPESETVAH